MEVGLFDHIGRSHGNLAQLFDDRIAFYSAADKMGFYCMHLAEHHCSPLNMAPSPSVFLAALARETKSIRLGPLCYLLTLYTPLRILEEICMLDHLSHGRLEIGVGRGVSPFELGYHNVDHAKSREMFIDAYHCLRAGMASDELTYAGDFYTYKAAPIELKTYQPSPAFWYGSSNAVGAAFAGEHGMHFTANGPTEFARRNIEAYKEALAKRGAPEVMKPEFPGGAAIGALRQIYVAETDAEAIAIAEPAAMKHQEEVNWLRSKHGVNELTARLNVPQALDFAGMVKTGSVIVGSPKTVLAELQTQTQTLGANYILAYMMFGSLSLEQSMRSLHLFNSEIMPTIKAL